MTIIAAVRTGTDLIVAADSKVTTQGSIGKDIHGNHIWQEQVYDYGTKIAVSIANIWTVAIVGQGAFGDNQVSDIVSNYVTEYPKSRHNQDTDMYKLIDVLKTIRITEYQKFKMPKETWPYTRLLLFSSDPEGRGVRAWVVDFFKDEVQINEILQYPGVYLAGSCEHSFTLLYNYNYTAINEVAATLEIPRSDLESALKEKYFPPVARINYSVMPIQDAIDFTAFLVKVQINMERFNPGTPKCGGAIDIAVVKGLPKHEILWFPGKELKHIGVI